MHLNPLLLLYGTFIHTNSKKQSLGCDQSKRYADPEVSEVSIPLKEYLKSPLRYLAFFAVKKINL